MYNLCTISDLTVDKPWNDLARAWNDLSRVWSECGQRHQNFQQFLFFSAIAKFRIPPKMCNNLGFTLDTLAGTNIQKHIQF